MASKSEAMISMHSCTQVQKNDVKSLSSQGLEAGLTWLEEHQESQRPSIASIIPPLKLDTGSAIHLDHASFVWGEQAGPCSEESFSSELLSLCYVCYCYCYYYYVRFLGDPGLGA